MGRIGLSEILIVALLAFLVVQPKDLFQFIRKAGKAYQQMKNLRDEFVNSIRKVEEEIGKPDAGTVKPSGRSAGKPGD